MGGERLKEKKVTTTRNTEQIRYSENKSVVKL